MRANAANEESRGADAIATSLVYAVVAICLIGAAAVVCIILWSPGGDKHQDLITFIGFIAPVVMALMALLTNTVLRRVRGLENKLNGRLDELLESRGHAERLRGRAEATQSGQAQAIVDSAEDAIWSKDLKGNVLSWNKAAERLFGWNAVEMLGRSILDIIPKEDHMEEAHLLDAVQHGERFDQQRVRRLHKDGHIITVTARLIPIRDAHGKVIAIASMGKPLP